MKPSTCYMACKEMKVGNKFYHVGETIHESHQWDPHQIALLTRTGFILPGQPQIQGMTNDEERSAELVLADGGNDVVDLETMQEKAHALLVTPTTMSYPKPPDMSVPLDVPKRGRPSKKTYGG